MVELPGIEMGTEKAGRSWLHVITEQQDRLLWFSILNVVVSIKT